MSKKSKQLSASLFLCLCRAASMISKGTPMKASEDARSVKALEERGLMLVRDGDAVPSLAGFKEVRGLAPVPTLLDYKPPMPEAKKDYWYGRVS